VTDSIVHTPRVPSRLPIPLLIKCGWALMALYGLTAVVLLSFAAVDAVAHGTFTIASLRTPVEEWLVAAPYIVLAALSGPFVWGVWKERPWTREVAMAFWICWVLMVVAATIVDPPERTKGLLWLLFWAIVPPVPAVLYFYGKRNVVLYYDELRVRGRGA